MKATLEKMKSIAKCALAGGVLLMSVAAYAQEYPTKTVTLVVPFGPGGSSDTYGRYIAAGLQKLWGQTVIVENRPGAGSAIGSAHVAQAKPDGYTLLFPSASFAAAPAIQTKLPFDPMKDLTPVAMVGISDFFVIAGSRAPLPTLGDLQREGKAQTIFYATPGLGSVTHLGQLLLNDTLGIKSEFVHYKSGAEMLTAVRGGRVDATIGILFEAKSGNGTPIAVMSSKRNPGLPDVPTVVESGFPNALASNWVGVFAPAGTPKEVVDKINRDIVSITKTPEAIAFFQAQALQASDDSPEEFATFVKNEIEKWTAVAERNNLRK